MIIFKKQQQLKFYDDIINNLDEYNEYKITDNTLLAFIKKVAKFAYFNDDLNGKSFKGLNSCGYARKDISACKAVFNENKLEYIFHNLLNHCGSLASCPVCSRKIASAKVQEIQKVFDFKEWADSGMMTLTAPHNFKTNINEFVKKMNKAFNDFISLRKGKNLLKDVVWSRVWEMNLGKNGWHYHFHVAMFSDGFINADELKKLWFHCLIKNGLIDTIDVNIKRYAFNFKHFNSNAKEKVSNYLNKLAFEMSHTMTKKGRKNSLGFFDICKKMMKNEKNFNEYYSRFCEYLVVTKGLRCRYSKNFRSIVDVKTDDEILGENTENKTVVIMWGLRKEQLKTLKKNLLFDEYLEVAKTLNVKKVNYFLECCEVGEVVNKELTERFDEAVKNDVSAYESKMLRIGEQKILQNYRNSYRTVDYTEADEAGEIFDSDCGCGCTSVNVFADFV